jgi:hypothetical protein
MLNGTGTFPGIRRKNKEHAKQKVTDIIAAPLQRGEEHRRHDTNDRRLVMLASMLNGIGTFFPGIRRKNKEHAKQKVTDIIAVPLQRGEEHRRYDTNRRRVMSASMLNGTGTFPGIRRKNKEHAKRFFLWKVRTFARKK